MNNVKVIENISYNETIGDAGKLDIYLPKNSKGAPLLIYFHGGGLEAGDKKDDRGMYLEVAEQGIIVVSANYRMYPDFGFPVYLEDASTAVACALECVKNYTKYGQVWIGGISAGGYISMMLHFAKDYLAWLAKNQNNISNFIIVGGMTDISVMQFALSQKSQLNEINRQANVIVVENATQTFENNAHNGNQMHAFALYNMYINGIMIAQI